MNVGIILSLPAWDSNVVKVFYDSSDNNLPIEVEVGGKNVWITGEQALEIAEFLIEAVEKSNNNKEEKTNGGIEAENKE